MHVLAVAWLAMAAAPAATAPPPLATKATELAAASDWETLYLTFASAAPARYPKAAQQKIARALHAGCIALSTDDAAMAFSLGEKSVTFAVTADSALCAAMAAKHAEQPEAAETLFRKGLPAASAHDGRLALELGRVLQDEGDLAGATAAWSRVPKKSPQFAEAQHLRSLATGASPAASAAAAEPSSGHSFESSVNADGQRIRGNSHFRFRSFSGQRDFGQRAEYEGRVQTALEQAQQASSRFLGLAREAPLDVILYSRDEFMLHHGPYAAAAVAGFYSANAIRLNNAANISAQTQATLVHEYVHGVVDEVSGFHDGRLPRWLNEGLAEWVEWQFEGGDAAPVGDRSSLRGLALGHSLPTLASMRQDPLISQRNPRLAYAYAAMAVRALAQMTSVRDLLALIREVGAGAQFETAFQSHFGRDLARFEEGLARDLAGR